MNYEEITCKEDYEEEDPEEIRELKKLAFLRVRNESLMKQIEGNIWKIKHLEIEGRVKENALNSMKIRNSYDEYRK